MNVPKVWESVRTLAELGDVTLHGLRHAFASVGVNSGLSLPVVGALLGHFSESMTARYGHLASDPIRQAADRISGQIAASLNGTPKADVIPITQQRREGSFFHLPFLNFVCIVCIMVMSSREVIRILERDGWVLHHQQGSHCQFKHPTKPGKVTVPHPKHDLPIGTLRSIWRQAGIIL